MSGQKIDKKARLVAEGKDMLAIFVYLAILLSIFTTYRRLLLAEYGIDYLQYGYSLIEALVLAKIILIGRFLRLGEKFGNRPLIVPTLYKTLCFGLFVLAFSILEHVVLGLWHGNNLTTVFEEIMSEGLWEILTRVLVLVVALVPLFAAWEASRANGEGKLFELFFKQGMGIERDIPLRSEFDKTA